MKNPDKTKDNIKVNNLSDDSRKKLFNKFVQAGGKITGDTKSEDIVRKDYKTNALSNKDRQSSYGHKNYTQKQKSKYFKPVTTEPANKKLPDTKPGLLTSFSQKLYIRLRLYFMNVTDFSASAFNIKFLHLFSTEYKIALMGVRLLFLEIFKRDHDLAYQILYKLEKINPLNLQLLEELPGLYNSIEIESITEEHLRYPEKVQDIIAIKDPLLSIFRKIYILKPFEHIIFSVLEKSIEYYISATKKKSSEYSLKRKNLKNDIYIIFEKLFPALYWLFCIYNHKIIALGSPEIEAILKIKPFKKKTDLIKKNISESDVKKDSNNKQPDNPAEEKKQLSEDGIEGLDILKHFIPANIKDLRLLYDRSNIFAHVKNNDKMLYAFLMLMEFDNEYSFLLTTNKIKFKFDYIGSGYINFKEKFLDLYDIIKNNMDLLKEYADSSDILLKMHEEKPFTNDRYIAHTKELSSLEKRRQQAANSAKFSILSYMSELSNILRSLIDDINGTNRIIENPNDIISFEISTDKNKKLNNKSISESLLLAHQFANAFIYKLSKGDLSGELEFDEQTINEKTLNKSNKEQIKNEKASSFPEQAENKNLNANNSSKNIEDEGSIMDELDDIAKK
jgi:hypothetical protein